VRVEEYAFVPNSCGAGKWRGGVGLRRSYRILAPEALLQMRTDRVGFAPYGLAGGRPGGRSQNFLETGTERRPLPGKVTMTVPNNAVIIHEQAGAGGFGDPRERDPALIRADLADGKITPGFAKAHYGFAPDTTRS
jgi:N-methylhydantoinase B